MSATRILFTGGGGSGQEALWRLLHQRYELYFADARPEAISPNIAADRRIGIPLANDPGFVPALQQACRDRRIDWLVPGVDEELLPLARAERQPGDPTLFLPAADFVALMLDKLACARALGAQGLAVPATVPVEDCASLRFPLILKPRSGRGSRGVVRIEEPAQVPAYLTLHRSAPGSVIAQECIEGQEYTVFVLADAQARLRAVVPVRVLEKRGVTIRAHTEANAAIMAYAGRFQAAFRPTGPYNIQCMLTPAGEVLPFEVNPRISTTFCLSFAAGVDAFALFSDESPAVTPAAFQAGLQLERHWHNHLQPTHR